jgi:glycosyltransferase involved in cell wall biosynthesis
MTRSQPIPVSIGIPTFNRADGYFRQALRSAVSQDYEPLEIIVSDNCSTDNTESFVRSINDPRIRYFRQPKNIDVNDNFNFCFEQAQGAYFLLLHDDDLIDPGFVTACMAAAGGRTDIGIIRTGTRLIDGDGNVIDEYPNRAEGLPLPAFFEAWLTGNTALYYCSTLFNTQGLKSLGGFHSPTNLFQDVVAEFRLMANLGHVDVPTVLASYRRHGANRGDSAKVMAWCEDCRYLLDLMCTLAPEDRVKLRELGRSFLSRKCYRKAGVIQDPVERWKTFWRICRYLNESESLVFTLKQFYHGLLRQKIKSLVR